MRNVGIPEEIGTEQWACQTGPAVVCSSAVDTGADRIVLIAENADAVVVGRQEHGIFRYAVLSAKAQELLFVQA